MLIRDETLAMRKVFISYRRLGAEIAAGALGRDLRERFGEEQIFRDKEDIGGGVPWRKEVLHAISRESTLLVLIGKDWANATDKHGIKRLDNSDDPLRLEITAALKEEAFIIPILLQNAEMPSEDELPTDLRALAGINALKLRDDDWLNDLGRICKTLENAGFRPVTSPPPQAEEAADSNSSNKVPPASGPVRSLNEILSGQWQVQIQAPYPPGVMGQLNVEMFPAGMFRGQLVNPMGIAAVEGQWQVNPAINQIGLKGYQTNGFQTAPYIVLVQISSFDSRQIAGMTSAGEQVNWRRVSSPPVPPTG
jgi:TIR domain-containing protein